MKLYYFGESIIDIDILSGEGFGDEEGLIIFLQIFEDYKEIVVILPAFHAEFMHHSVEKSLLWIDLGITTKGE